MRIGRRDGEGVWRTCLAKGVTSPGASGRSTALSLAGEDRSGRGTTSSLSASPEELLNEGEAARLPERAGEVIPWLRALPFCSMLPP